MQTDREKTNKYCLRGVIYFEMIWYCSTCLDADKLRMNNGKQTLVGRACSEEWLAAWKFLQATMYFLIYVFLSQPCLKIQFDSVIRYLTETKRRFILATKYSFSTSISQFTNVLLVMMTSYFL